MRRALACLALATLLAGCENVMRDMYEQPRLDPYEASPLFPDGAASRLPPPGSVAHSAGALAGSSSGREGVAIIARASAAQRAQSIPYPLTRALLQHGRERFAIYCAPCHSPVGDGDGMIVRRGFPAPPSYHSARLRAAPDRHFYDVMTNGYGIMYSYADRVPPADRWAIVAWIRVLQRSQYARLASLPATARARLESSR